MGTIEKLVGGQHVREEDLFLVEFMNGESGKRKKSTRFEAGRDAAELIFAERDVPGDLLKAAKLVCREAASTPYAAHAETPEFKLAAVIAAYAIGREQA